MKNLNHPAVGLFAKTSIAVAVIALSLIVACSTLSIWRVFRRVSPSHTKPRYQPISERYEDEDGTATEESEAAYSYQLPRVLALLVALAGLVDSLILCVIITWSSNSTLEVENWLQSAVWVGSLGNSLFQRIGPAG
jgi:hypothetical protein